QTLLGKNYNKGFVWLNRYSDNEKTDDIGRWARIGYYNGFMISWITGFLVKTGKVEDKRKVGVCNMFLVHLQFPTSSNQGGAVEKFDNIEDAKKYTVEMFNDFKKLINK
ncbi:MAG: hypothetical protein AABY22_35285, partial [Nanoarchaeota archaeon]